MRIALDAGHGKHNRTRGVYDPGMSAQGPGDEHTKVEGMCVRLKNDLTVLGHKILLTHDMPLGERDDAAAEFGAQLLVSIHLNAGGGTGPEAYINWDATKTARKVAANLCENVSKVLKLRNRGIKYTKSLAVLRKLKSDLLFEICFGDNSKDMAAFHANVDKLELAMLNSILTGIGNQPVKTLPRTWKR